LADVEKPDAIICGVDEYSLGLGLLVRRIRGGRVFAIIEDPPFTTRYERIRGRRGRIEKRLRTRLLRSLLEHCAGLFCFIEKDVLEELGLRKAPLYQMMNGASSFALDWANKNSSDGNSTGTFTVGLVGALTPTQGIESLLEIVSLTKQKNENVRLRLIGSVETSYTGTFQRKIKELKLDSCTEVTGWLPYLKMLEKLHQCEVGVYCNPPTEWYRLAQPLKICEYFALAKPTVAWAYPGTSRMLDGGRYGILVESGNKDIFSDALLRLTDFAARKYFSDQINVATKGCLSSEYWYSRVLDLMQSN
jgi:glycosyltransferase involved in cell wall biosynthesis